MSDTLSDLTRLVTQVNDIYAELHGIDRDGLWCLAKMQEELGELTGAHLSLIGQSRTRGKTPEDLLQDRQDELADLLGFLLVYAQMEGIDPGAALRRKWGQYLPETL